MNRLTLNGEAFVFQTCNTVQQDVNQTTRGLQVTAGAKFGSPLTTVLNCVLGEKKNSFRKLSVEL